MWAVLCSISSLINIASPWNGENFCRELKRSRVKHDSWSSFEKKLGIPPHSFDGSFVMIIRAFKYNFFINLGSTYSKKLLKSAIKFQMWSYNVLFYWKCSASLGFVWKLLDFWKQVLKGGSSDWAFWKRLLWM